MLPEAVRADIERATNALEAASGERPRGGWCELIPFPGAA